MSYFQYIEALLPHDHIAALNQKTMLADWLTDRIGKQGDYRHGILNDWSWSLGEHQSGVPIGIYFAKEEDKAFFRLTFDVGFGRKLY